MYDCITLDKKAFSIIWLFQENDIVKIIMGNTIGKFIDVILEDYNWYSKLNMTKKIIENNNFCKWSLFNAIKMIGNAIESENIQIRVNLSKEFRFRWSRKNNTKPTKYCIKKPVLL